MSRDEGNTIDSITERWRQKWRDLADERHVVFRWPPATPLEVAEQMDVTRFEETARLHRMPFVWLQSGSRPATTLSWALLAVLIELGFFALCAFLNLVHFAIYSDGTATVRFVAAVSLLGCGAFIAFKGWLLSLLMEWTRNAVKMILPTLSIQLVIQWATCAILLLTATFALAADFGGYDEALLYGVRRPLLIRFVAILSLLFIPVQLGLRILLTAPVYKFKQEERAFEELLDNAFWRYRKHIRFAYCSIRENSMRIERERARKETVVSTELANHLNSVNRQVSARSYYAPRLKKPRKKSRRIGRSPNKRTSSPEKSITSSGAARRHGDDRVRIQIEDTEDDEDERRLLSDGDTGECSPSAPLSPPISGSPDGQNHHPQPPSKHHSSRLSLKPLNIHIHVNPLAGAQDPPLE